MRFKDWKAERFDTVTNVCLALSLGAIFLQIWVLIAGLESLLQGKHETLWASVLLSGIALICCALAAWTTLLNLHKGETDSRTPEYRIES